MDIPEGESGMDLDGSIPTEMEIVDAFTHLIFSGGDELTPREMDIIHTLCLIDDNAANCLAADYPREVGVYLRALGVTEMIQLVAKVREQYLPSSPAKTGSHAWRDQPARA